MLTVKQVAERIGAGASSVRLWVKAGRFKGAQFVEPPAGLPYWLIPETALEGFEKQKPGPKASKKPAAKAAKRSRKGQ